MLNLMRVCGAVILTALVTAATAGAADVAGFGIVKSQEFTQQVGALPQPNTNSYSCQAFAIATTNGVLTNATLKSSVASTNYPLYPDTANLVWRRDHHFNTEAEMNAVYPNSQSFTPVTYTVTMATVNDGLRSVGLKFYLLAPLFALSWPVTPEITNLPALQAVDHTAETTIQWKNLGGSTLAVVQVSVFDTNENLLFISPAPFTDGAPNGASSSFTLPAYALPPGMTLTGHVSIANPGAPDTNTYAGVVGAPAFARDTAFPIVTRPAPPAPRLAPLPPVAGQFRLLLSQLETNRNYHLEASPNLRDWTALLVTNPAGSSVTFTDAGSLTNPARLYRARIGP